MVIPAKAGISGSNDSRGGAETQRFWATQRREAALLPSAIDPLAVNPPRSQYSQMRTITINCEGTKSAAEIWQRYIDAAKPEGASLFGHNLDAFWDAVEHGGPGWPGEARLVFKSSSGLATIEVGGGLSLLDGLRRIANETTRTQIELA